VKAAFEAEFERLLQGQSGRAIQPRRRLEAGVLLASGEIGYSTLTVQAVLDRTGDGRTRFYDEFASLGDCYAAAYSREIEIFAWRLLRGCSGGWRTGLHKALAELESLVLEQPLFARGLLVEVNVAGEPALTKKRELWERLSRALDRARRETTGSRHSPPPLTAPFMVGAIETAVGSVLLDRNENFPETIRFLGDLILETYFG
jgi:AcrR family transcriptional regulator